MFLKILKMPELSEKFENVLKKILNDSAESVSYMLFAGFLLQHLSSSKMESSFLALRVSKKRRAFIREQNILKKICFLFKQKESPFGLLYKACDRKPH